MHLNTFAEYMEIINPFSPKQRHESLVSNSSKTKIIPLKKDRFLFSLSENNTNSLNIVSSSYVPKPVVPFFRNFFGGVYHYHNRYWEITS